jgi:integrase/recombinase XerD
MTKSNLIRNDLSSCITLPYDTKHSVKNIPTPKEMCEFIDTVEPNTPIRKRDRVILELLYSGLRSSELRRIKLNHLDLEERTLWIGKAKRGSDRLVPLGEWLIPVLVDYLENARPVFTKNGTDLLFPSKNGKEITRQNLRDLIKKYAERADIVKAISPHTFRSCTATHLLDSGADIRKVQLLLGHEDIKSTQVYLKQTYSVLKAAHLKYHPRQRDAA